VVVGVGVDVGVDVDVCIGVGVVWMCLWMWMCVYVCERGCVYVPKSTIFGKRAPYFWNEPYIGAGLYW